MSRIRTSGLSGLLAALVAAAPLVLVPFASAAGPRPAKVQLRSTSVGRVLANGSGFTLYVFTRDRKSMDSCVMISGCTSVWPVLKTGGKPVPGAGLKAGFLGTITLAHGVEQVTYAGRPLYGYIGDSGPGQTGYVGTPQFGGTWYAINAAGKLVR